ncbi:MAG TPA: hypothetical protein VKF60_13740 [Myxococcota bacterium]|nr:hypothetical protein [Myxococcota bacterium]
MESEKIKLKTEAGQVIEAVVLSKHADRIDVVIAESVRCSLTPTRNQLAYVGNVRGREVTYERSRADVEAELAKHDPNRRRFR